MPTYPEWIWVPPSYIATPAGCVFVPGYWDYLVVDRGLMFAPVYIAQPVYAQPAFVYTPTVTINVALITDFFFCRPQYNHYFYGDYYAFSGAGGPYQPWFAYHESRVGYDPIYAWSSSVYGQRDPGWSTYVRESYYERVERVEYRPPVTYLAQQRYLEHHQNAGAGRFALASSLAQVERADGFRNLRLEQIGETRRAELSHRQETLGAFRDRRAALETAARDRTDQTRAALTARRLELPRSPLAATRPASLVQRGAAPGATAAAILPQAQERRRQALDQLATQRQQRDAEGRARLEQLGAGQTAQIQQRKDQQAGQAAQIQQQRGEQLAGFQQRQQQQATQDQQARQAMAERRQTLEADARARLDQQRADQATQVQQRQSQQAAQIQQQHAAQVQQREHLQQQLQARQQQQAQAAQGRSGATSPASSTANPFAARRDDIQQQLDQRRQQAIQQQAAQAEAQRAELQRRARPAPTHRRLRRRFASSGNNASRPRPPSSSRPSRPASSSLTPCASNNSRPSKPPRSDSSNGRPASKPAPARPCASSKPPRCDSNSSRLSKPPRCDSSSKPVNRSTPSRYDSSSKPSKPPRCDSSSNRPSSSEP